MEYLLTYCAGLISMMILYSIFHRPEDYLKNRIAALENELDNRDICESKLQNEITTLSAKLGKYEQLTTEKSLMKQAREIDEKKFKGELK